MNFKKLRILWAAIVFATLSSQAQALPNNALYLTIDGSGSIAGGDFTTQLQGYEAALNAIIPAFFGQVAIGVSVFSSSAIEKVAIFEISNAADLLFLTNAIIAIGQPGGGTGIGIAIDDARAAIGASIFSGVANRVIDVSTDGVSFIGVSPSTATANAIAAGYTVNCLAIVGGSCNFVPVGNRFAAATFAGIQAALETKLQQELVVSVPEPGTLGLLGLGLLGLGWMRRRSLVTA